MKKTHLLVLVLMLIGLSSCRSVVAPEFNLEPVVKKVESNELNFKELLDKSDVVVLAKVKDQLDLANSTVVSETNFFALRDIEVLEVFENKSELDIEEKDHLLIREAAAIDIENVYYTSNHMPLSEKSQYVLFLNEIVNGEFEIVDGDNGVVNIDSIISNQNIETTVNSLFKYFGGTINNKPVEYVELTLVDQPTNVKFERTTVKMEDFEIPVRLGKDTASNREYLVLGTFTFELSKPMIDSIK